jgi:hypothetical protein
MRWREFIAGLGSVVAWPCAVQGQQALPVVGLAIAGHSEIAAERLSAFHKGGGQQATMPAVAVRLPIGRRRL